MADVAELNVNNYLVDSTSLMIMLSTVLSILPPIAAIISIVFMLIRIYETQTVQDLIWKYKSRNKKDYYDE